jgi:hypothetical protein
MVRIPIAIINASTLVEHQEIVDAAAALQVQVSRDFAPFWNVDAQIAVVPPGALPPAGAWWVVALDNSDLGNALGYHDLTSEGLPIAKVFIETSRQAGQDWTVLFSHEILEMLSDPYISLTALVPTAQGMLLYAYENCDACQSDASGYKIGGRLVSDFCTPAWFDANKAGTSGPFDFRKLITQPFELLAGGYAMLRNVSVGGAWTIVTAPAATKASLAQALRPRIGSRRERRKTGLGGWIKSNVEVGRDFSVADLTLPSVSSLL